jgi:hypothetical protein
MNSPPIFTPKVREQTGALSRRICVLVLGMHRSGTSALTRVLSIAGARLPSTLLGANESNETGHWESQALLSCHDRLLGRLGSDWEDWRSLEIGRLPASERKEIKAEIAELLRLEFGGAGLFVLKDPRICRFADLYLETLADADIAVRIVHAVRNPLEVAESLHRRNGTLRADAMLQWLRHVLDSEAATRAHERVLVAFGALVSDWRSVFDRITSGLDLAWPYSAEEISGQVEAFLDAKRCHHRHTTEELLLDPGIGRWVEQAYSALLVLTRSPRSKTAMAALDAVRAEFDRVAPVLFQFRSEWRDDAGRQREALQSLLDDANAGLKQAAAAAGQDRQEIAFLGGALAYERALHKEAWEAAAQDAQAARQRIAGLRGELAAANARADRSEAEIAERDRQLAELKSALAASQAAAQEHMSRAGDLDAALKQKLSDSAALEAELEDRERRLGALTAQLGHAERQVGELQRRAAEAETRADTANKVASEREAAELNRQLEEARAQSAALGVRLGEKDAELRRLESEKVTILNQHQQGINEVIQQFRTSMSWRITRPLRDLRSLLIRIRDIPSRSGLRARLWATLNVRRSNQPHLRGHPSEVLLLHGGEAKEIAASGLFDEAYYRAMFPGERIADPISHYLRIGHKLGINPNPLFDADYYSTLYAAHIAEGENPFVHFVRSGSKKCLDPSRLFQASCYRDAHADVAGGTLSPLAHYLQIGRIEKRLPVDADRSDFNPLAVRMHQLDPRSPEATAFDPEVYRQLYPKLAEKLGEGRCALQAHYESFGRDEGRVGTPAAFLSACGMPPEAVPINFDNVEYYELNADLGLVLPANFYSALQHYLRHGLREGRRYSYSQCYIESPWMRRATSGPVAKSESKPCTEKVACLVHVYYPEIWPDLCPYIRNLDGVDCDVYVNIVDSIWAEDLHQQIRHDVPNANIGIAENCGRDIGGHMASLTGVNIDDYVAFFLVHTKKSRHFSEKYSGNWRNSLLYPLMGDPEKVAENISLMSSDQRIGIIGAAAWRHHDVADNDEHYTYLLRKLGISPESEVGEYVSGTMMMVRPEILQRVYDLLRDEVFENADGKDVEWLRDGQLEHAVERVLVAICRSLDLRVHWC